MLIKSPNKARIRIGTFKFSELFLKILVIAKRIADVAT